MARKSRTKRVKEGPGWIKGMLGKVRPEQWVRVRRRVCQVVVVGVLTGAVVLGFRHLDGYVQGVTGERGVKLSVAMASRPEWASDALIKDICLSSGIRSDDNLLDETLTRKWAGNLAKNPWVKQVREVRKRYDGQVRVDCELREPIAVIYKTTGKCYVDAEGVVLPGVELAGRYAHVVQLRDRVNVRALPEPGETIQSKSLIAGLELLGMFRRMDEELGGSEPLWPELAVLDVSNYEGQLDSAAAHLTLYTRNQTEVRWGAALGRSVPYHEASWQQKLAALYRVHKQQGFLGGARCVELRDG